MLPPGMRKVEYRGSTYYNDARNRWYKVERGQFVLTTPPGDDGGEDDDSDSDSDSDESDEASGVEEGEAADEQIQLQSSSSRTQRRPQRDIEEDDDEAEEEAEEESEEDDQEEHQTQYSATAGHGALVNLTSRTRSMSISQGRDIVNLPPPPYHEVIGGNSAGLSAGQLDPSFRQRERPIRFFVVGKVFKVLWAEPTTSDPTTAITPGYTVGHLGQRVFQRIRRFIVIIEGPQSCTAVPIVTHNGNGVAGRTNQKHHYSIVYTGREAPTPLAREAPQRFEQGMKPYAIRVNPDERTDQLDPMSRINYSKLYTIEHNLRVKPFGMVHDLSKADFFAQVREGLAATIGVRRGQPQSGPGRQMTNRAQSYDRPDPSRPLPIPGRGRGASPGQTASYDPGYSTSQGALQQGMYGSTPNAPPMMGYAQNTSGRVPANATPRSEQGQNQLTAEGLLANRAIIISRLEQRGFSRDAAEAEFQRMINAHSNS